MRHLGGYKGPREHSPVFGGEESSLLPAGLEPFDPAAVDLGGFGGDDEDEPAAALATLSQAAEGAPDSSRGGGDGAGETIGDGREAAAEAADDEGVVRGRRGRSRVPAGV
jgi:hypothetical protein